MFRKYGLKGEIQSTFYVSGHFFATSFHALQNSDIQTHHTASVYLHYHYISYAPNTGKTDCNKNQ